MDYIVNHSLRTLIKSGDIISLQFIWYNKPDISIQNFKVITPTITIWENLEFEFIIGWKDNQMLLIDYIIYFVKANWKLSWKTFKISKKKIKKWESIKHLLKWMTTLKLYPWKHFIELQINGEKFWKNSFDFNI